MLILPHYHNHLTFTVDGLNFAAPNDVRYAFRLEGADRNWTPYTAVNSWTYSNLSPGIYFFSVKAINADGVESVEPVFYGPIIIASKPDEYQIPYWAWMVIIMLAAGCLYAIVFFIANRERRLKKMRLMLEDKVKIRTAEVERQNQEKEVMLKEIHHRVKNNLQIINSLMNLQVDSVEDEGVKEVFREARNRIASMALIHEKIYENRMLVNIRMKDYIRELVHKLIESYRIGDNVRLNMNIGDDVVMNMNQIVPVGLILNEIISNSLKYAFPDQRKGRIIVEMTRDSQGYYVLTAGDDGVGLPAGFSVEKNRSLGMELIELLTDQLGGELKLDGTEGVRYTLRFKGQ
jgi:two-component sensor histidine kinase